MPDEPFAYRDDRSLHDQIIGHDLANLDAERTAKLLVIEVRKLRETMAEVAAYLRPKDSKEG